VQEWVYAYKITSADELKQCIADERDKMGQQWHKGLFPHDGWLVGWLVGV